MKIQPGVGYNFDSSSKGFTLDTSDPFPDSKAAQTYQQFQCVVFSEVTGSTTKFFLKTYKGVCNYTWSTFPFYPAPESGGEIAFRSFEKQVRITDWAVYENGSRSAGSATDGPDFEWMAGNGKIELPAGESGKSVLVTISKIDWWDKESWLSAYRTIDAERPFISVFDAADENIGGILMQQGCSLIVGPTIYSDSTGLTIDPSYPNLIGYTYKKIAQLDWNDTTETWDVTQYLLGPIDLPMHNSVSGPFLAGGTAPGTSTYDTKLADEFSDLLNYAWFEGMWAYPGYTMNPSNWWFQLINE
jgi:hypothetical protein